MKYSIVILSLVVLMLASCEKDKQTIDILEGNYSGTFQRYGPTLDLYQSQVDLQLQSGLFTGESSEHHYPAICEGTYGDIRTDSVTFENTCVFTADFDWSLILDGRYAYELRSDTLIIHRSYGTGGPIDRYELTRE